MTKRVAEVGESRWEGEPAITLRAGEVQATFVPGVGMTGVSLRFRGREHLAVPGGIAALKAGRTAGLPLLAPWANRLAARRYRAGGVSVDLRDLPLRTDANGLPIHGLLVGRPGWHVEGTSVRGATARLRASIDVDDDAFPFPHRIELTVVVTGTGLRINTGVAATRRRSVPIAFGWHPYLQIPGTPRTRWRLRLPRRRHLALDDRGIPAGGADAEPPEAEPIGRRKFDDLYALGRGRRLAFEAETATVELRCGSGYPFAQVWVPAGRRFAALEPMTSPTNALVEGTAPLVAPGERYTAGFELTLT